MTRCSMDEIAEHLSRMTWLEWLAAAVLCGVICGRQLSILLGVLLDAWERFHG